MIDYEHVFLVGVAIVAAIAVVSVVGMAAYLLISAERVRRETMEIIAIMGSYIGRLEALLGSSSERSGKDLRSR